MQNGLELKFENSWLPHTYELLHLPYVSFSLLSFVTQASPVFFTFEQSVTAKKSKFGATSKILFVYQDVRGCLECEDFIFVKIFLF